MGNNIDVEVFFTEILPDGKKRKHKKQVVLGSDKRLRKILHNLCNEMADIQTLGQYERKRYMDIHLKGSEKDNYCQQFYINKRGKVIAIMGGAEYTHNWSYSRLISVSRHGLSCGKVKEIEISYPNGLGDIGGDVVGNIAMGVASNAACEILKKIWNCIKEKIKNYRGICAPSDMLMKQIILKKKEWRVYDLRQLFNLSENKVIEVLCGLKYKRSGNCWIKGK